MQLRICPLDFFFPFSDKNAWGVPFRVTAQQQSIYLRVLMGRLASDILLGVAHHLRDVAGLIGGRVEVSGWNPKTWHRWLW